MELSQIYAPIKDDLDKVRDAITALSPENHTWLKEQLHNLMRGTGKGLRPAMTLLCGKLYQYDLKYLLPMAVSIELMHTSTLVHDDAIDKAETRRGQSTINNIWGTEIAILMGDFLFAKAGESVADTQSPRVVKLFSHTLAIISSGEINQFRESFNLNQTREDYYKRIYSKTGSLFSLATQSGAILSQAPEWAVSALQEYGDNLGTAFQIVDDILDFTSTEEVMGKPVGSDLIQGTLTLPAMLLINRYPQDNPISKLFETKDNKYVAQAIDMVRNSSIINECYQIASEYCDKACDNLKQLPEKTTRQSLFDLADFVLKQKV